MPAWTALAIPNKAPPTTSATSNRELPLRRRSRCMPLLSVWTPELSGGTQVSATRQQASKTAGRRHLEHDRDRPVVDDLDGHAGAEGSRGDLDAELAQRFAEVLVERLGELRRRGVRE